MKAQSTIVLMVVFCMAFMANAEASEWAWKNPGADPFDGTLVDAVDMVYWWPEEVKEDIRQSDLSQFGSSEVKRNELVGAMTFGSGETRKIRRDVPCTWDGIRYDRQSGKPLGPVTEDQAPAREMIFIYPEGDLIYYYRVRQCDWCTNFLFDRWTDQVQPEQKIKVQLKPKPRPIPRKEVTQEPTPEPTHVSLCCYTRLNHFDNDQFDSYDRYMYDEGEAGLCFNWRPTKWKNLRLGLDAGIDGRIYTVDNGQDQVLDGLLYKLSPNISLNPVWRTYLMARYSAVFSHNGLDGQTIIGLIQYYLPVGKGIFQPMFQVGGSATQAEPRYLGHHNANPAPLALYYETKTRLQLLSFWSMRLGWEAKWFWFYGTRLGENLEPTGELQYEAYGRPEFGGPFAQVDLPWGIQLDATVWRQEILVETFIMTEEESYWLPGQKDEWRWNLELTKRFRIRIF